MSRTPASQPDLFNGRGIERRDGLSRDDTLRLARQEMIDTGSPDLFDAGDNLTSDGSLLTLEVRLEVAEPPEPPEPTDDDNDDEGEAECWECGLPISECLVGGMTDEEYAEAYRHPFRETPDFRCLACPLGLDHSVHDLPHLPDCEHADDPEWRSWYCCREAQS